MRKILIVVLFAAVLVPAGYALRLDALGWYLWHSYVSGDEPSGFNLGDYAVAIDGKRIPGLSDVSGLTFHEPSGTLFSVLNDEPVIIQLSKQGELLRQIRVEGVSDMEGISHVGNNQFLVVEESKNRLILLEVTDADTINTENLPKLTLGFANESNKNFEGISWDDKNKRILIVKEKKPLRLVEIHGLLQSADDPNAEITIRDLGQDKPALVYAFRDLASLTYHEQTGHLLLLSEESKLIKEYGQDGKALSAMLLWQGFHGLEKPVPQAEGIAIGPDRTIYIVSEPNLFYAFKPANID
jgi:uncharacterized protein YjiK